MIACSYENDEFHIEDIWGDGDDEIYLTREEAKMVRDALNVFLEDE